MIFLFSHIDGSGFWPSIYFLYKAPCRAKNSSLNRVEKAFQSKKLKYFFSNILEGSRLIEVLKRFFFYGGRDFDDSLKSRFAALRKVNFHFIFALLFLIFFSFFIIVSSIWFSSIIMVGLLVVDDFDSRRICLWLSLLCCLINIRVILFTVSHIFFVSVLQIHCFTLLFFWLLLFSISPK